MIWPVKPEIGSTETSPREKPNRLNPELVVEPLVFTTPPAPRFVETEEKNSASADKLLDGQQLAGQSGAERLYRQNFGGGFRPQ